MRYLEQLKALEIAEKAPECELTKLTKVPSVSFVSAKDRHFSEKKAANRAAQAATEMQNANSDVDVDGRIEEACRGLTITPAKFKSFLDGHDFNEIRSGEWTPESMRAYAELWASGKGYLH